jgi:hypothetical protein
MENSLQHFSLQQQKQVYSNPEDNHFVEGKIVPEHDQEMEEGGDV